MCKTVIIFTPSKFNHEEHMENYEYNLPSFSEEHIDELCDLHEVVGMQILYYKMLKMLKSKYGVVHDVTIFFRKNAQLIIAESQNEYDKKYVNSTLQDKLNERIDYADDPINIAKKKGLNGLVYLSNLNIF